MPAEPALSSPYGNSGGDLQSPVPQDQSGPEAQASSPTPKMGAVPGQTSPGASPETAAPAQNPFDAALDKVQKGKGEPHNPFQEMDPNLPLGYTPISARLRKDPHGQMQHLRNDGQWAPFGEEENSIAGNIMEGLNHFAIRTKEDIPRFVGAVAGTVLAERMGLGPWASAFMMGSGQAAGGVASSVAQGQTPTVGQVGADVGLGAASSLIPAGIGKVFAGKAAAAGAESAMAPLIKQGGEELQNRFLQEQAAAQAIGAKPGPSQTARELETVKQMGPEAQKLYQMAWGKAAQFKESLNNLVSRAMGGYEQEIGIEKPDFNKVIGGIMREHGQTIGRYKGLAQTESGGQVFDIDPVLSSTREQIQKMLPKGATLFDDSGKLNARLLSESKEKFPTLFSPATRELVNVYQELFNATKVGVNANEAGAFMNSTPADRLLEPVARQSELAIEQSIENAQPRLKPGLTLEEMDKYRKAFGRRAEFQSLNRSEANDAYAQLHHVMSDHLDNKMIDTLGAKYPQEAQTLMASKEYYSGVKEMAEDLQAKLEKDPENAARALIDPKNPKQAKALWTMLKPKQQDYLAGGYLNTLLDPTVDEISGRMKVASAENAWNKVDPQIKELMYGKEGAKHIDSMINYAKGINLKPPGAYNPESDGLMSRFVGLAHAMNPKGAYQFISSLFSKNPKAQDFITDKLSSVLMPTGDNEAAKQVWMNRSSQAILSKPMRFGVAPLMGADLGTSHEKRP